jgi:hypothetical protein
MRRGPQNYAGRARHGVLTSNSFDRPLALYPMPVRLLRAIRAAANGLQRSLDVESPVSGEHAQEGEGQARRQVRDEGKSLTR